MLGFTTLGPDFVRRSGIGRGRKSNALEQVGPDAAELRQAFPGSRRIASSSSEGGSWKVNTHAFHAVVDERLGRRLVISVLRR